MPNPDHSRILIEVSPEAPATLLPGRHDFMIRGHVIAALPIEEIALLNEGRRVGRILFGMAEMSTPAALPDGAGAVQRNFVFHLAVAPAAGGARRAFSILARGFDETAHDASFVLIHDEANPAGGIVAEGPTSAIAPPQDAPPAIIMYAERAAIDTHGLLQVDGWAVARSRLVTIQIFVDGERVGSAVLGGVRDDVGGAHPGYPNARLAGFSLSMRLADPPRDAKHVRAQVVTAAGTSQETLLPLERLPPAAAMPPPDAAPDTQPPALGPPAVALPADARRAIKLFCDEATLGTDGVLDVIGWAVSGVGVTGVSVLLDGAPVGDATLGLPRPDVGEAFPAIPSARFAGFRLTAQALGAASAGHEVTIRARNGLDDQTEQRQTVTAQDILRDAPADADEQAGGQPARPDAAAFKFQLDNPALVDGIVTQPITGRLTIEGWVLGRDGIEGIDVFLDGQLLGAAHYGQARQDVASAYPEWANALRSGYAFHVPPRSLRDGAHEITLRVRGKTGDTFDKSFRMTVAKSADSDEGARIRRRIAGGEAQLYTDILRRLDWQPRFRILIRDPEAAAPGHLAATLGSIAAQVYPHWRVDLLGAGPALREAVAAIVAAGRIPPDRIACLDDAAAAAGFAPDGDGQHATAPLLVGALVAGDELGCDALAEIAVQSGLHRSAALLYADELRQETASGGREAFFKPGFSPDLLLATNYIGRPWFAMSGLLANTGASPRSLRDNGDYDLLLRCVEHIGHDGVRGVPRLLCERARDGAEDPASESAALTRMAMRRGLQAAVEPGLVPGTWRLRRSLMRPGLVSVIIPTCAANGHIRTCLATLRARTAYRQIEIIAIDNIPAEMEADKAWLRETADKVVDIPEAFNWSRFNNLAAAVADGDFLLFLNDDIEVIQPDWLDAMLEHAQRDEIGIVGPQLLYPDRTVQHAGMFLAGPGLARHAFRYAAADEPGYFGLALTVRNVTAVTGACMLVRRATFDALGGFDEAHEVINNDLDFCLRAQEAGLLTVYTPHASLIHHELASRAEMQDVYNLDHFESRWALRFAAGDPYFSPSLSTGFDDYRPNEEPAREVFSGHPLFLPADIRRILVVKVDHIGDFVTAVPAIRRLKEHFPAARIAVLASATVRSFAALDPSIDEIIDFNFFHVKSALGQRRVAASELAALTARLAPYGFDLAIDLRKHLDTRELLRCAGARFTAGFDYNGQFPWLDVSLEWEGDRRMHGKRYHITDDLLHLVDTVATAARQDRTGIRPEAVAALCESADIPAAVQAFIAQPTVCVHAGAGNVMKQWPLEYFATLIDMLITRNAVRVLLIGGPDELDTEKQLLASIAHTDRVMSAVGRLKLEVLPAVIAGCSLYVGNDSGPKHIAASVGVPTVGVHSGTVDPVEWAPLGPRSVAVARAMQCGPCYLNRLEDCSRELACMRDLPPLAVHRVCETMLARPVPASRSAQPARVAAAARVEVAVQPLRRRTKTSGRKQTGATRTSLLAASDDQGND